MVNFYDTLTTVGIALAIVVFSPYLLADIMNTGQPLDKQLTVPPGLTLLTPFVRSWQRA